MNIKKLANSSLIVMIVLVVSKFLGLIRDSLMAKSFGLNDVQSFALGTTMLFISISYGITAVLIPIHSKIKEVKNQDERNIFISNVINVVMIFTLLIVFGCIAGAKYIVLIFGSSLARDAAVYAEAVYLLRVMLLSLLFVSVQSILTAVLQCYNKFLITSSAPIFSNLIYILYLLIFVNKFGLRGFGFATVLGFFTMMAINIPTFIKLGYRYKFVIDFNDENIKQMGKQLVPIVLCSSLVQINIFIVRGFAGSLAPGYMAAIDYANRLDMLVYEVFAQAITIVIYPTLALYISKKDSKGFSKELVKGINLVMMLMVPASIGLLVLREPLLAIYLKRGEFTASSVTLTSNALMYYIPTMIGYGVRDVINRGFFSINNVKTPMMNSILNVILNILACAMAVGTGSIKAIALASSIATIISTVILFMSLKKKIEDIDMGNIIKAILKILVASIVMGVMVYFTNNILVDITNSEMLNYLITLVASTLVGVVVYFILLLVLKLEDLKYYIKVVKKNEKC